MIFCDEQTARALDASGRRQQVLEALQRPFARPAVPRSVWEAGFPGRSNHRVLHLDELRVAYSITPHGTVVDHVGTTRTYARRLADPAEPSHAEAPAQPKWTDAIRPTHWILLVATLAALPRLVPFWWGDEFYSVGFLVAPWAFWAVLRRKPTHPAPESWRYAAMGTAAILVLAGWFLRSPLLSLWGVAAALALHALEQGTHRTAWIPAALLAITVPPPGSQTLLLWSQKAVAMLSEASLEALGLPVVRDNFLIQGPNYSYAVEPLCTGLTGVLASVLLVGMVANHLHVPRRMALLALAIAVGGTILLNIERIVLLVAITEVRGPSLIQGAFHDGVGLVLSLLAFAAAIPALLQK